MGRFLFSGEDADKPLDGLSGGERQRLSLAILVQSGANVLILDEPTNHLDVDSREALEDALSQFTGSLLLVSHDRALLDAVKPVKAPKPAAAKAARPVDNSKLEAQIEKAEAALAAIEDELAGPDAWSTPQRSAESSAKHEAAKAAVEELYARYEQVAG